MNELHYGINIEEIGRITGEDQKVNLLQQLPKLKMNGEKILELAQSFEHNTINEIMEMDDIELALSVLSGKIKSPK